MKTLLIDNYDSFSYNVFQLAAKVNGVEPDVYTNDAGGWQKIDFSLYDNIIISPGPGHPDKESDFGICKKIIASIDKPILGICLGHQGISSVFGARVVHANAPIHGQIDVITHNQNSLFSNIPDRFKVVRYHSLIVAVDLPDDLELICWNDDNLVMGVKHKTKCIYGVQFHPESICSEYGEQLFKNFNQVTSDFHKGKTFSTKASHIKLSTHENISQIKSTYQLKFVSHDFTADVSVLFSKLYENDKKAIWLDSSITQHNISIISLSNGPLSYSLTYSLSDNAINIKKRDENHIVTNTNIFDYLNNILTTTKIDVSDFPFQFQCGFVGYFGYELKQLVLQTKNKHDFSLPDAQFLFSDRAILIDHHRGICYFLALDLNNEFQEPIKLWFDSMKKLLLSLRSQTKTQGLECENIFETSTYLEMNKAHYLQAINQSINHIKDGESYEICLTNRININKKVDPLNYYLILRQMNPAPFAAFLAFDDCHVASSSIERFLKIDTEGWIETKPIKGTLPRKQNIHDDEKMIIALQNEIKYKSENLMIVDLLRNDLGQVCEIGSVHVPQLMAVESYKSVHQLVSTIRGKKKQTVSTIDCIKACFPGGSMTGAPKLRTLEIIDNLETSSRGIYSGAIGYLSLNGAIDLNIVIRTAIITGDKFSVAVGGAIIALSDATEEYKEILLKSDSLMKALSYYIETEEQGEVMLV